MTSTARPYAVSSSSPKADMPITAWITPVASTSAIAPLASVEKRPTAAASARVRSAGSSSRVAPRSTSTSTAMPPSHALTASTWTTFAGALSQTGG